MTKTDGDLVFVGDNGDTIDFSDSEVWNHVTDTATVAGQEGNFKEYTSDTNSNIHVFIDEDVTIVGL